MKNPVYWLLDYWSRDPQKRLRPYTLGHRARFIFTS